jgi:hypothetical protein
MRYVLLTWNPGPDDDEQYTPKQWLDDMVLPLQSGRLPKGRHNIFFNLGHRVHNVNVGQPLRHITVGVMALLASGSLCAGCASRAQSSSDGSSNSAATTGLPSTALTVTPSVVSPSIIDPGVLPVKVLSAPPSAPTCGASLKTYSVFLASVPAAALTTLTAELPAAQAVTTDEDTIGKGILTSKVHVSVFPATVTMTSGFNPKLGTTLTNRAMWAIEYTGLDLPDPVGNPHRSPGGPTPTQITLHSAADFVDGATGLVAFTQLCP